jgi:hypothetical protein
MRVTHLSDGTPVPVYEPGDFVRLLRDEPGEVVTARGGEWGQVLANRGAHGLDIRLAGHSRPRSTDLPVVTSVPSSYVIPCDRLGVRIELQRDFASAAPGTRRRA